MSQSNSIRDVCGFAATPSFEWLNRDRARRVAILEGIAAGLDARRDEILAVCSEETALTVEELAPEFARMTGTLRMFAGVVREGSWVRAAIDPPVQSPRRSIGPNHDVRRMLVPLGAVAVFGASNFPLAYGVCGGDTASALAAGCTVVVKEHPAHVRTGRLIFEIARREIVDKGGPGNYPGFVMGYIQNEDPTDYSVAQELVRNEFIQAVGFTGSQGGGKALVDLSRNRERPIPVFAEMGSVNPVYVMAGAAATRGREIADELADSILARHGQQCTRPGLIFVQEAGRVGGELRSRLIERFRAAQGRDMLAPWIRDAFLKRIDRCKSVEGVVLLAQGLEQAGPRGASPTLLATDQGTWSRHSREGTLRGEIFGPAAILIDCTPGPELAKLLAAHKAKPQIGPDLSTEPHLVCSYYIGPGDEPFVRAPKTDLGWLPLFGRITENAVPTGVRVAHGMVHGGPYPATNRPDTTAVGPFAIERWCRPVCFQNCPHEVLPLELQDANPLGIMRIVNGEWTRDPLNRS